MQIHKGLHSQFILKTHNNWFLGFFNAPKGFFEGKILVNDTLSQNKLNAIKNKEVYCVHKKETFKKNSPIKKKEIAENKAKTLDIKNRTFKKNNNFSEKDKISEKIVRTLEIRNQTLEKILISRIKESNLRKMARTFEIRNQTIQKILISPK